MSVYPTFGADFVIHIKRKRHPRVEASQMPYSYQVAGPGIEPGTS